MAIPSQYSAEQTQFVIDAIRHCQMLGIKVLDASKGTLTLELPYSQSLIGNPETGVLHGGAISTLLDTACGMAAALSFDNFTLCPTLDLRIDYMRAAKPGNAIKAYAEVYRTTSNIVFTRGTAHQGDTDKPVAHCVATFMRLANVDVKPPANWPQ